MSEAASDAPTPWRVKADTRVEIDSQKHEHQYISGFNIYAADGAEVIGIEGILGDAEERAKRIAAAVNSYASMVEALKEAQAVLVLLTDLLEHRTTRATVHKAWADAVSAELKCRKALAQTGEKFA